MTRRSGVGTGVLVAAGFLLVQLAWILTMPPATGIDEFDHIHRAASVATGHWGYSRHEIDRDLGRGGLIPVPKDIVAATDPGCEGFAYAGQANCNAYAPSSDGLVLIACAAARYNPMFYVLVGYPAALFHGTAALTAMRVVAAMLSAGMLALAAIAIRTWARTGWPLLGLFLAATPTVVYSSSLAAPNGLNIASGLTLWAALLGFLYGNDDALVRRRLLIIAGVAAVTLVNTHTLGVLWLALIVTAVAIQRGRLDVPRIPLAQRRMTWSTLIVALGGLCFAVGWILVARTNSPSAEGTTFTHAWWHSALSGGLPTWPLQAIAAFPMRDEMAPLPVYAIGMSMICSLAVVAVVTLVRRRSWSSLWTIAFVALTSVAVPLALTAVSYHQIGLAWQGRYQMPFTGGLLLLYALAVDRSTTRLPVAMAACVMAFLALMNLLGQLKVTQKFVDSPVVDATRWHLPSAAWLSVLVVGYAIGGALAVQRAQRQRAA